MRDSPSGPRNGRFILKLPAGTTINAGSNWGSTCPLADSKNGDNVIVNWDPSSFGARGPLQAEAQLESGNSLAIVQVWNYTANPITTGSDLFLIVQAIPQ